VMVPAGFEARCPRLSRFGKSGEYQGTA